MPGHSGLRESGAALACLDWKALLLQSKAVCFEGAVSEEGTVLHVLYTTLLCPVAVSLPRARLRFQIGLRRLEICTSCVHIYIKNLPLKSGRKEPL